MYCEQFSKWQAQSTPEFFFHRKQIEKFYQDNELNINFLNSAIQKQNIEYFVTDLQGNVKLEKGEPIFLDNLKKKEYQDNLNALFEKKIEITINGYRI